MAVSWNFSRTTFIISAWHDRCKVPPAVAVAGFRNNTTYVCLLYRLVLEKKRIRLSFFFFVLALAPLAYLSAAKMRLKHVSEGAEVVIFAQRENKIKIHWPGSLTINCFWMDLPTRAYRGDG